MADSSLTPWRAMPWVVKTLVYVMASAWLAVQFLSDDVKNTLFYTFAVIPARFDPANQYAFGSWWEAIAPIVGHVFLHADFRQLGPMHIGMNCIMLMASGPLVANRLGTPRFLLLYFLSALGGALATIVLSPGSEIASVGASDAICGVFGGYFLAWAPDPRQAWRYPQVRQAATMFFLVNIVLAGVLSASGVLPIAWQAHLGGFVVGALSFLALAPRRAAGPWDQRPA